MRMRILSAIHAWANRRPGESPTTTTTPVKDIAAAPTAFEFSFPLKDTLIQVENCHDTVVIRATRDTFTETQKAAFIDELAAEGFIPSTCHWCNSSGYQRADEPDVRWVIDHSWLELTDEVLAPSRRLMIRLFIGAGTLWVVLLASLFLHAGK